MTTSRFDPRNLALYDKAPDLLHLEFGAEGRVYRYVRAEDYPAVALDEDTRRTQAERALKLSHTEIRTNLLKGSA